MTVSHSYNPSRQDAHEEEPFPVPTTVYTHLFPVVPAAAMHARTQQRLHPLLCGVNLAPTNIMIPAGRTQGGKLYGRYRGSAVSDWNGSGGI